MTEILFRVDGGERAGMGHIMEMLHLAEVFHRGYSIKPVFAIARDEVAKQVVRQRGEEILDLPEESEIQSLSQIAQRRGIGKIILNLMEIPEGYPRALKQAGFSIVNLVEGTKDPISDYVIDFAKNPEWMILNPVFSRTGKRKEIHPEVEALLVCFGASDPFGLTLRVTRLLCEQLPDKKVHVITGTSFQYWKELEQLKSRFANMSLFQDISVEKVAELMLNSSLAVTAGGDMMYELVAVGTPVVVLCPSQRQVMASALFQRRGIVHRVGLHTDVDDSAVIDSVRKLQDDFKARREMSQRGMELMDGNGGVKVAKMISQFWRCGENLKKEIIR